MSTDDRPDDAKRLQAARESAGFPSAKSAADRFGWNYDTYAQHENGTRGIQRGAKGYARAFKVSAGWLLTGDGHGPDSDPMLADLIFRFHRLTERQRMAVLAVARSYEPKTPEAAQEEGHDPDASDGE